MPDMISTRDIPFEIFGLLRGSNREIHTRVLFMIFEMCNERIERVVTLSDLLDRMRSEKVMSSFEETDIGFDGVDVDLGDGRRMVNRELTEINLLRGVKLIRRHVRYDASSRDNVMMVFLSSLGLKLVHFLMDVSKDTSDNVRLVNIQNAVSNIRFISSENSAADHPYVCLKAAYDNINDFIMRLSEFSSDFYDFVDSNPVDAKNVVSAGEWFKKVLGSRFVHDFYELNNYSLGHVARINEIGHKAELILKNENILDWIVYDKVQTEQTVSKTIDVSSALMDPGLIREDVLMMLQRLVVVADHEFGSLMRYLDGIVFDVIQRARYVVLSHVGGSGVSSYATKLAQLIRMYESTGTEPPVELFNIYRSRLVDQNSLVRKPRVNDIVEYDAKAFGVSSLVDMEKPSFFNYRGSAKKYVKEHVPEGQTVSIADLPLQSFDDYKEFWSMLLMAIEAQPDSAVRVLRFMDQVVNGDYSYPGGLIEREAGALDVDE